LAAFAHVAADHSHRETICHNILTIHDIAADGAFSSVLGYHCCMEDTLARAEREAASLHLELGDLLPFTGKLNSTETVDYWIVQVPVGILFEVWRTQVQLPLAIRQENIPQLAFLCRNALELNIWAQYVVSTPSAAKRFHQDAYVDGVEVLKLMGKVFTHTPAELHPGIQSQLDPLLPELERVLVRDKVGYSVDELRNLKHLQIGAVAKEVGYGPVYEIWNPILSKLVHATAYNILVAGKDMDGIGSKLVERTAAELRSAVANIERYLDANKLPRFQAVS